MRYRVVCESSVTKWSGLTEAQSHTTGCVSGNRSYDAPSVCLPSTGGSDPIFCCYCWMSGKKAAHREKRQEKHTIILHSKLLKRKKLGDIYCRNRTFGLIGGHVALSFFFPWVCSCINCHNNLQNTFMEPNSSLHLRLQIQMSSLQSLWQLTNKTHTEERKNSTVPFLNS